MPQHLPAVADWHSVVFMRLEEGETLQMELSVTAAVSRKEVWRNIKLLASCEEHLCRPLGQEYAVVPQSCFAPPSWSSLLSPWHPKQA